MAVATDVKTFWSALLSVLLKCIAALGFARQAPAAVTVLPQAVPAGTLPPAAARTESGGARAGGSRNRRPKRAKAAQPDRDTRRTATGSGTGACRVPAPRGCEPQVGGRDRKRTLPPTMKQRISAEAHGSSPSARSLRVDDVLDAEFAGAVTVPTGAGAAAGTGTGTGAGSNAGAGAGARAEGGSGAGSGANVMAGATASSAALARV
jgi:hypothetical protein